MKKPVRVKALHLSIQFFFRNQKEPEAPTANLLKIKEKAKCQRLQGKTGEQRAKHSHSHSHRREISGNTEGEKEN
jgi:hypothetical protein